MKMPEVNVRNFNIDIETADFLEVRLLSDAEGGGWTYSRTTTWLNGKPIFKLQSEEIIFDDIKKQWRLDELLWNPLKNPDGRNTWEVGGKQCQYTLEVVTADEKVNYGQLFRSQDFTDLVFELRDGATIKAHKCVISLRCPVWAALLKSPMEDSITGKILLKDVSPEVARQFIETLYTGKIKKNYIIDNLKLADKYQIRWLLDSAVKKIRKFIKEPEIFKGAFEFARRVNASEELVMNIINHLKYQIKDCDPDNIGVMLGLKQEKVEQILDH